MIKQSITALMLCGFISPCITWSASTPQTPEAKAWLADLRHVPSREEIEKLSKHVDEVMAKDTQKTCTAINPRLRKMIFLHFAMYQHLINQRSIYLSEKNIAHWAHVFGMLLKESSGDTTNITSMTGRSYTNNDSQSDLKRWREITTLSKTSKIPLNYQTNFGLTQLSADRLFVALHIAGDPAYLKNKKKEEIDNTAVAVRKLIWFYQDFAQGRLTQDHDRIHQHEKGNPEYAARFTAGTSMALLLCGTHYMFYEGFHEKETGAAELTKAMTSIAYCKLGDEKSGFGMKPENQICFAEWVTLCPTLNFDIAMLTPLKYFETRNAAPVCEDTFKALMVKKPVHHKKTASKKEPEPKVSRPLQDNPPGSRVKIILNAVKSLLKDFFGDSTHSSR